jgi:hypothetical protein
MTIVMVGNDEKLINSYQKIKDELPNSQITILIENEQHMLHSALSTDKQKTLGPCVFSKVKYVDIKNKVLITQNGGSLSYDALIIFPLLIPSLALDEDIINVFYPPFECSEYLNSTKNQKQTQTLLLIGDTHKDVQDKISPHKDLIIKKCSIEEIKQLHVFEKKVTSVTLNDKFVYPIDYVFVSSMKYELPSFVHQCTFTPSQMELLDLYLMNNPIEPKLLQILSKLKPIGKVLCIKSMELIADCEYIERPKGKRFCHCHDICKAQNLELPLSRSYFTKSMENKLILRNNLDEDFYCSEAPDDLPEIISWIAKAKQALERRIHLYSIQIPEQLPELSYFGAPAYLPENETIKKALRWITDSNHFVLKELINKKRIEQRIFSTGSSSISKNEPFILYYGSNSSHINEFYQTYKNASCDIKIATMGCSGLELSLSYGWDYLAGYLEQEYCLNLPQCCGIILDSPCLMNNSLNIIESRRIPLLKTCLIKDNQEYYEFYENCKKNTKNFQDLFSASFENKILLDQCSQKDLNSFDKWILIPACSGNWTKATFLEQIKILQQENYAFFACGCSLTTLMNASYYSEYLPASQTRNFYGSGSFASILEIAQKFKQQKVNILLEGMLKIDALIDAVTLNIHYSYPIISNDAEVQKQLKILEPFL